MGRCRADTIDLTKLSGVKRLSAGCSYANHVSHDIGRLYRSMLTCSEGATLLDFIEAMAGKTTLPSVPKHKMPMAASLSGTTANSTISTMETNSPAIAQVRLYAIADER